LAFGLRHIQWIDPGEGHAIDPVLGPFHAPALFASRIRYPLPGTILPVHPAVAAYDSAYEDIGALVAEAFSEDGLEPRVPQPGTRDLEPRVPQPVADQASPA